MELTWRVFVYCVTAPVVNYKRDNGHVILLSEASGYYVMYAAARLLGLRVRIPSRAWISVCGEWCVLSSRGICIGLFTRPEDSYRVWCVWVWSWSLDNGEALACWGLLRPGGGLVYHTVCTNKYNAKKFYVLPTQCIYAFCMDLGTNSDYFPIQH